MSLSRRDFLRAAAVGIACGPALAQGVTPPSYPPSPFPPIFYDSDGLIVHRGVDGGDTSQREGWYWLGVWVRKNVLNDPWPVPRTLTFSEVAKLMEPAGDGVFHRHPKLPPWNNPHDKGLGYSRDQMVPMVAALGVWGLQDALRRLWRALPQDPVGGTKHTFNGDWIRFLGIKVAHQGDVVGPMTINHFRRAWNENPWPAGDKNGPGGEEELRGNVALRLHLSRTDMGDTGDDLNLIVMLLLAIIRFPSDVSQSAIEIYKHRAESYGSWLGAYRDKYGVDMNADESEIIRRIQEGISQGWKKDASAVLGAVRWYHRAETGANPAIAELYEPIIRKWFE